MDAVYQDVEVYTNLEAQQLCLSPSFGIWLLFFLIQKAAQFQCIAGCLINMLESIRPKMDTAKVPCHYHQNLVELLGVKALSPCMPCVTMKGLTNQDLQKMCESAARSGLSIIVVICQEQAKQVNL